MMQVFGCTGTYLPVAQYHVLSVGDDVQRRVPCSLWAAGAAIPRLAQPAPRVMPTLRPSFTVILWGCSMSLWPRIFQHIQSNVDGDVSVAKKRLPAEVLPFLEAVCALLLRPHRDQPS